MLVTGIVIGVIVGAGTMAALFAHWEFRGRQAYKEFSRKDAIALSEKVAANWGGVVTQASGREADYHKNVADEMIQVFDSGLAVGADLRRESVRFYRRQVETWERKAEAADRDREVSKAEWQKERQLLVNVKLAAKALISALPTDHATKKKHLVAALKSYNEGTKS